MPDRIKNRRALLTNASTEKDRQAREIALDLLSTALNAADPRTAVLKFLSLVDGRLRVRSLEFNLSSFSRVFVLGAGKASGAMAEAVEQILDDSISAGIVNVLHGTKSMFNTKRIRLHEAGHPIPSEDGVEGARRIYEMAAAAQKDDLIIFLISGGGSALLPLPARGIRLEDKVSTTDLLLKSGARIDEINTVRKHLSAIKGGRLAEAAYPATMLSFIVSDVVGDPLEFIASGPTVPDSTTYRDAMEVLKRHSLWERVPPPVREVLTEGERGMREETPKSGAPCFSTIHNFVIANNRMVIESVLATAKFLRLESSIISTSLEGEARDVGAWFGTIVEEACREPIAKPRVLVAGGETTVTVKGRGVGGRNQEMCLSAIPKISGRDGICIASIGTDGLDGRTEVAGALVDGHSLERALSMGLDPGKYLQENDSYNFFRKLEDTIITGPTGTNVNDLSVIVVV